MPTAEPRLPARYPINSRLAATSAMSGCAENGIEIGNSTSQKQAMTWLRQRSSSSTGDRSASNPTETVQKCMPNLSPQVTAHVPDGLFVGHVAPVTAAAQVMHLSRAQVVQASARLL